MPRKTVQRSSLSDQATELLKEAILTLEIEPGERLIVDDLAEMFKISRTPIREALRNLSARGLIDYNGIIYKVSKFSRNDVVELYSVRIVLEVLAAEQAAERITAAQIKRLEQNHEQYKLEQPQATLIELDAQFHTMILNASRNQRLQHIQTTLSEQILFLRRWLFQGQSKKSIETDTIIEHADILEAISNHDSAKAGELMRIHLQKAQRRLISILDGNDYFQGD